MPCHAAVLFEQRIRRLVDIVIVLISQGHCWERSSTYIALFVERKVMYGMHGAPVIVHSILSFFWRFDASTRIMCSSIMSPNDAISGF